MFCGEELNSVFVAFGHIATAWRGGARSSLGSWPPSRRAFLGAELVPANSGWRQVVSPRSAHLNPMCVQIHLICSLCRNNNYCLNGLPCVRALGIDMDIFYRHDRSAPTQSGFPWLKRALCFQQKRAKQLATRRQNLGDEARDCLISKGESGRPRCKSDL